MQNTPFPSVSELFGESWKTYKQSLLNMFLLNLVSLFVGAAIFLVFGIISFGLLAITGLASHLSSSNFSSLISSPIVIIGLVVIAIIYILVASLVQSGYLGAIILMVAKADEKPSLGQVLKDGFGKAVPLFLTGILTSFLMIGALVPFIFPALIVGFFLSFVTYEVVLENKKLNGAVASSVGVVTAHFGDIFVRALLMIVISLAISFIMYLPQLMLQIIDAAIKSSGLLASIWRLFMVVPNLLVSWFGIVYAIVLYKQARAITPDETKSKTVWLWAMAIFGWLVLVLTMFGVGLFVKANWASIQSKLNTPKNSAISAQVAKTVTTSPKAQSLIDSSLANLEMANKLAARGNLTQTDKNLIANFDAQAISDAKQATILEPENPVGWANLGKIYFSLGKVITGAMDWAQTSYNQAISLDPNNYLYHESLGGLYLNTKDYANAILQFQIVTELAPDYANGFYNLGIAYKASGDKVNAKVAFQKCLDLLPSDSKDRPLVQKELL